MIKLLLPYYLVFLAAVFVWPSWRSWRSNRINPIVLPKNDAPEGYIVLWFKKLAAGMLIVTVSLALGLERRHLGAIEWLDVASLRAAGMVLLVVSLPIVALAQAAMGSSWRIGIDATRPTELVTAGIFSRSRNPIFLGLRINLLGLFLTLPNAATLTFWLLGEVLMGLQVRLEEAHLQNVFGNSYEAYAARTPRWC